MGHVTRSGESRTRAWAIAGTALTVMVGLGSRALPIGIGIWDKSLGDVMYAVMVYGVLVCVRPESHPRALGPVAFLVCFGIELLQLTGIAMQLPHLVRFALGTAFAWHDVLCYVVGSALASTVHWCALPR